MKHKNLFLKLLLLLAFQLASGHIFGQVDGGGGPFGDGGFPDADIPIDGGLTLLIAGGIVYAGNEIRNRMKKEKSETL